ncbi:hypothetical protein JZ751_006224, partial [Albula glossodonta]
AEMMSAKKPYPEESHTVWEKLPVKLFCTVQGHPTPVVKGLKDGVVINRLKAPGKYMMESKYGHEDIPDLAEGRCRDASAVHAKVLSLMSFDPPSLKTAGPPGCHLSTPLMKNQA